ncbi:MAG: beta-galactosidase, partial [Treponema sp.]|nr:beta-galactosidase [Treponema sp.]
TFDTSLFPYLTAELGGGLQVTRHRRPVATAQDIGAMTLSKLGSGVNLLGYYMYHGGTNPKGKLSSLHESRATGSINDVPELSYDFRAPIREYGQISDTYREIKLFSYFVHDFGEDLCRMPAIIPEKNPFNPKDSKAIRYSWRIQNGSGYLFVNNYQRRQIQSNHTQVVFTAPVHTDDGKDIRFPPLDIKNGDYFFLPFGIQVGDAFLETALVTPLCIISGNSVDDKTRSKLTWIFYTSFTYAEELLQRDLLDDLFQFKNGFWPTTVNIVTLKRKEALNLWKFRDTFIIDESVLLEDGENIFRYTRKPGPHIEYHPIDESKFTKNKQSFRHWKIQIPQWAGEDLFLTISWEGDVARLYEDEELLADDFYTGKGHQWEIGLKRFGHGKSHELILEIEPLYKNTPVFLETWPHFQEGIVCACSSIHSEIEEKQQL